MVDIIPNTNILIDKFLNAFIKQLNYSTVINLESFFFDVPFSRQRLNRFWFLKHHMFIYLSNQEIPSILFLKIIKTLMDFGSYFTSRSMLLKHKVENSQVHCKKVLQKYRQRIATPYGFFL